MEARDSRGALEPYFSCTGEERRDRLALGIPHLDYIIYSYYINNQTGTDGRPMICKKPSVTGRRRRPVHRYLQHSRILTQTACPGTVTRNGPNHVPYSNPCPLRTACT